MKKNNIKKGSKIEFKLSKRSPAIAEGIVTVPGGILMWIKPTKINGRAFKESNDLCIHKSCFIKEIL